MAEREPELRYGRIVWATLKDPRGFRKERPGIILTPTAEIRVDAPLVLMAVTTTFPDPPPPNHVPLPWNADPRASARASAQRSAAVVDWLDTVYPDEVTAVKGDLPPRVLRELEQRLQSKHDAEAKRSDDPDASAE